MQILFFFCRVNVTHLIYAALHLFRPVGKNFAQKFFLYVKEKAFLPPVKIFDTRVKTSLKTSFNSLVYLDSKAPANSEIHLVR